jgi:uncharacterized protein (DUF2237 family)
MLHSITEAYAGSNSPTGTFAREGCCRSCCDNASMHTSLLGMLAEELGEIQYDGEDEAQRPYSHDRSFLLVPRSKDARSTDIARRGYICCGDRSRHACKILNHLICRGT